MSGPSPNPRRPEGTYDVLPVPHGSQPEERLAGWLALESAVRSVCARYGYQEIRPPLFEHTSLFAKSTGEVTDIVEKEMFTVPSRGEGDSYTFRPEITPGAIRLLIENRLFQQKAFWKVWYWGPNFRYERPQKGRYRQFVQMGVEAVGSHDPLLDVETMAVYAEILRLVGVMKFDVRINTMGCPACRGGYREALRAFLEPHLASYCGNCRRRFERNVLRVLDCKVPEDARRNESAPAIADQVCAGCRAHFEAVQAGLRSVGLAFAVDKKIVRGLDYYTRTVYEFASPLLGAQNALVGGGRYDTLVASMGGPDVGAVGFAAGAERVLLAMRESGRPAAGLPPPDFFAVAADEAARGEIFLAAQTMRAAGLSGDLDYERRSVKAQMRAANKTGARYAVFIGAEELARRAVKIKRMEGGDEGVMSLDEAIRVIKGETR
ncbi:MAG: histidine--tRNA ligase [Planctomycetes bacterium]|nr:histidine--tRNA ligase [Planctomycetota bacterium]